MGTYYAAGIILGHQDYREADRLVSIYSKEYGIIRAVARGSRKITSKLAGTLEPFIMATFMIVHGRHYDTIAHAEVIKNYKEIKNDYAKIQLASNLGVMIGQLTQGHQKDLKIFELIEEIFHWLDHPQANIKKFLSVRWYTLWRLLSYSGYHPELYSCQACKKKITEKDNFFSYSRGGLVHASCRQAADSSVSLSVNAIKYLRHLLDKSLADNTRVQVEPTLVKEIESLTVNFVEYILEQQLKSASFSTPD